MGGSHYSSFYFCCIHRTSLRFDPSLVTVPIPGTYFSLGSSRAVPVTLIQYAPVDFRRGFHPGFLKPLAGLSLDPPDIIHSKSRSPPPRFVSRHHSYRLAEWMNHLSRRHSSQSVRQSLTASHWRASNPKGPHRLLDLSDRSIHSLASSERPNR